MKTSLLNSYYELESGVYVFYEYSEGVTVRRFVCSRVAVAYDSHTLEFGKLGKAEDIMHWAAERRTALRELGERDRASRLVVALLPSDHPIVELNRLEADSYYLTTFLQKAGII